MTSTTSTTAPGLDLEALSTYLAGAGVLLQGRLRAELVSGGRSNLTFLVFDDKSTWILRRPPLAGGTPSAHDMRREHRVVSALAATDFPVARPVLLCEDVSVIGAQFTLVDYVMGRVIRTEDELSAIGSDDDVRQCAYGIVDVLADLHGISPAGVGVDDWGRPDGYLSRQVNRWASQWRVVRLEDDVRDGDVRRLHSRLAAATPSPSGTSIVHGDFRIDNVIVGSAKPHRVKAVLDWELSTLGDPLADVALMCAYRDPALSQVLGVKAAWASPRLPTPDELAQRYSLVSGSPLQHWEFYSALGYFKLAVIAAGIDYRRRTNDGIHDGAGDAVAPLVARGLQTLRG